MLKNAGKRHWYTMFFQRTRNRRSQERRFFQTRACSGPGIMVYWHAEKSMIQRKKSFFFIKYFYRWQTVGLCVLLGAATLWFYYRALYAVCRYPYWFPVVLSGVNVLLLTVSTFCIRRPGKPETKMRLHVAAMFILLIVNPALVVSLSETFLSILWTLSIATYLLFCLLFVRYEKRDWLLPGLPLATFFLHAGFRLLLDGRLPENVAFLGLFGFLMSVFYAMFFFFFKFSLDNARESLSVYVDNKDIAGFLEAYKLTRREKEICFCIVNGCSAKRTGEKLFISEGTVKNHTKSIYRKIGISGRMELMHLIWDFTLLKG
jgi:DNA-binding CsgD family transcriptional regulator